MRLLIWTLLPFLLTAVARADESLLEQGERLFLERRYLESAIAYRAFSETYPAHERAQDALRFAVSASRKAVEQFGEDPTESTPIVAFAREMESPVGCGWNPWKPENQLRRVKSVLRRLREQDTHDSRLSARLALHEAREILEHEARAVATASDPTTAARVSRFAYRLAAAVWQHARRISPPDRRDGFLLTARILDVFLEHSELPQLSSRVRFWVARALLAGEAWWAVAELYEVEPKHPATGAEVEEVLSLAQWAGAPADVLTRLRARLP